MQCIPPQPRFPVFLITGYIPVIGLQACESRNHLRLQVKARMVVVLPIESGTEDSTVAAEVEAGSAEPISASAIVSGTALGAFSRSCAMGVVSGAFAGKAAASGTADFAGEGAAAFGAAVSASEVAAAFGTAVSKGAGSAAALALGSVEAAVTVGSADFCLGCSGAGISGAGAVTCGSGVLAACKEFNT